VTESVDVFELYFNREIVGNIVEEINRYAKQFSCGHNLPSKSPFTTKRVISTPRFGDIITRDRHELIYNFFCISLPMKASKIFKGQRNFSKFFQ
jgi:hypothetical protein